MLKDVDQIDYPRRSKELKEVFHLYVFKASYRDKLYDILRENGIDAKIHYPIPMHLQPAAKSLDINWVIFLKQNQQLKKLFPYLFMNSLLLNNLRKWLIS